MARLRTEPVQWEVYRRSTGRVSCHVAEDTVGSNGRDSRVVAWRECEFEVAT